MTKRIESPVEKFPGFVTLHDPLTYPQLIAYHDATEKASELGETTWIKLRFALLPGVLACVESWEIEGLQEEPTVDNFPATPLIPSGELITWLQEEITKLLVEAETVPNE